MTVMQHVCDELSPQIGQLVRDASVPLSEESLDFECEGLHISGAEGSHSSSFLT